MHNLVQDIRFAWRTMSKSPGFTIVAVLTLAIGIGANTAIFSVINAVFFHPLPVNDPEHLVLIYTTDDLNRSGSNTYLPVSHPNGEDIQRHAQSFSAIALYGNSNVSMTIDGLPEDLNAQIATGNFFDLLGVPAAFGRTFRPEEDRELGAGPVIVLSYGLWQRKFGADPKILGKPVSLNGQGFTIIGVAPRGFQGPSILAGADLWVPMSMHNEIFTGMQKSLFDERRFLGLSMVAKLKDGTSLDQARSELQSIGLNLQHDYAFPNHGRNFAALSLLESSINPNFRGVLVRAGALMVTVVGLVLLIASANIANLLLARAVRRKREISIRVAIGASRSRIIAQLLTEAILLAIIGATVGLGLAVLGRDLLWKFRPPFFQQGLTTATLDSRVLLFTIGSAIGTGLIFGLAPAIQASRPNIVAELKERAGGEVYTGRRFNVRNGFIIAQVALCLVALSGAGLFLLSLRNAQKIDPGFDTHNLGMFSFNLGSLHYEEPRAREFRRRALEAVRVIPEVKSATLTTRIPFFGLPYGRSVFPEGDVGASVKNGVLTQIASVDPGYFQTMDIPMVEGQDFDESVRDDSLKVAIINESAARRFWPNQNAIGRRFQFYGSDDLIKVIGVVHDSKYIALGEDPIPFMYLPFVQSPGPEVTLFFRGKTDPAFILSSVRTQVQSLDRSLPITNVWPIGEVISQALWGARFGAGLLAVFAIIAVVLCAIGIYGVVGYTVGQRIREFGIRLALGAPPSKVFLMVLRQSGSIILVGLAAGLICSLVMARLTTNLLYGVNPSSPIAFILMAVVLGLVGLVASYVPARHAATVDLIIALRNE
jgi:predicted permease